MLAGIKFGSWVPNCHCKCIGGFKFGVLVWDRHTYNRVRILADFNLAVAQADSQTAKLNSPPNFLAIQYIDFWALERPLYCENQLTHW